jgi:hypothetical protein
LGFKPVESQPPAVTISILETLEVAGESKQNPHRRQGTPQRHYSLLAFSGVAGTEGTISVINANQWAS